MPLATQDSDEGEAADRICIHILSPSPVDLCERIASSSLGRYIGSERSSDNEFPAMFLILLFL